MPSKTSEIRPVEPLKAEMPLDSLQSVPAIFSNIYNVSLNKLYARITFGETVLSPQAKVHTAIAISTEDLRTLGEAIKAALEALENSDGK